MRKIKITARVIIGMGALLVSIVGTTSYTDGSEIAAFIERLSPNLLIILFGTLCVACGIVLSLLLSRWIASPLSEATTGMKALINGNYDVKLRGMDRRDEMGDLARTLELFKEKAFSWQLMERENEESQIKAMSQQSEALYAMAATLESEAASAVLDVGTLTSELTEAATRLNAIAVTTSRSAAESSAATIQTMTGAEVVAAATRQLQTSITAIASQVGATRNDARAAATASKSAQETMAELTEATARIGSVAKLIADIACQTNLLALNATIEAARAGDAGKGFAVVAGEVKVLADQTARATEEITAQIAAMRKVSDMASESMANIASAITDVETGTGTIAAAIDQQSAATGEIAVSISQTADAASKVQALMSELVDEAERSRDLSDEVRKDGTRINETIGSFNTILGRVIWTSSKDIDRRKHNRYGVFFPCKAAVDLSDNVENADMRDAVITNISTGGLCLLMDGHRLEVGQKIIVDSNEFGGRKTMRVMAVGKQYLSLAFDEADALPESAIKRVAHHGSLALLKKAQSDHEAFVANVLKTVDGNSSAKAADLANHHTCLLGKWYDSVSDGRILSCPAFDAMVDPHKRVHDAGKRALSAFWEGKSDETERAVQDLKQSSREVIHLLNTLAMEIEREECVSTA